jgi:hypothetical protein
MPPHFKDEHEVSFRSVGPRSHSRRFERNAFSCFHNAQSETKKEKIMKQSINSFKIAGAIALLALGTGCATTANNTAIDTSQKEMMLTKAGFVPRTVTTPTAQQKLATLTVAKVSAVTYKKKLYYVYPTGKTNQILVGKQAHYDSYKKMLVAQAAQAQTSANAPAQRDSSAPLYGETAGPNRISVEEFYGDGPLTNNPMWP